MAISKTYLAKSIFLSPFYAALTVVFAVGYYLLFIYLMGLSGNILFVKLPWYLIYALVVTSAVLLTIAVYSIKNSIMPYVGASTGAWSAVSTSVGSLFASCGCTAPLLAPLLYDIGLNTIAVSSFMSAVSSYQSYIFAALILLNLFFIYYSISSASRKCVINRGKVLVPIKTK
ncbi:MAG: hypothetical protein QXG73_02620 [Candidatus Micrarchaeaceae archaeon]